MPLDFELRRRGNIEGFVAMGIVYFLPWTMDGVRQI